MIFRKDKRKTNTLLLILILLISLILILLIILKINDKPINSEKSGENETQNNNSDINENNEYDDLLSLYNSYKTINKDYTGQIYFDSSLIDLPFVQGESNDTYFRTDWTTMNYDVGGSIFLDYRNDINNDQNLIIYGHNYTVEQDPTSSKFFSPLRILMNKENYFNNRIINIFIGDKLLKYEVVYVYKVKVCEDNGIQYLDEDEPFYDTPNFTNEEFIDYINKVNDRLYYDTGKSIDYSDRMLTLQTCIDNEIDKLIINAKLIETIDVPN